MKLKIKKAGINVKLLLAVVALVIIGIVFVYSASSYTAENELGNKYYFLTKQIIGAVIGGVCLAGAIFFPVQKLQKFALPLYIVSIILLALVLIPGIGIEKYGARRWLGFSSFSIQPSEIAKFAFVIFAAALMAKKPARVGKFKGFLFIGALGLLICVLIILEPNMSVTMCIAIITIAMLFIGGAKIKHMAVAVLPLVVAVPLLIIAEPYRLERLMAFLDPWASPKDEGYQLIQSFYALGSGGWFGVGLFNSRQKFNFLPFAESDFIFAVIGEETGFVGALCVLLLFVVVVYQGIKISRNALTRFECYTAAGISCIIAVQTLINIAVVTGSIPPTGLPLPFISSGGSSLMVFMAGAGILLNIDRNTRKHKISSHAIL